MDMLREILPYTVQESHYTGLNTWHWLYPALQAALVFLIVVMIIWQYQKKLTYSKGVSLAYGVCAIASVSYLATELNNIAYYTQAVPARNYILYHLRYEVLAVGTMLIWVIWRTLGGRWSSGRARIVPWLLGGLIFWAMVMLGLSLRRLEMLEFLTLYGYMEEANNLNIFLFAILMFLDNSASKLEREAEEAGK